MEKPFTEAADGVAAGIGLIRDGAPAAVCGAVALLAFDEYAAANS